MSEQGHKKNINGSLATLPNEVGRVTSDQKVGRVTSDHLTVYLATFTIKINQM